jgi:asparagine synthase (glutamine-hydrolysing)
MLACRGPDHQSIWSDGDAIIGHRRLKILDLSDRSNQPVVSPDGRLVLAYNGEVYNHQDLAPAPSDTLSLLSGCPVLARAPERLRGMFAYALWDRSTRTLELVRDRFGIKPMYFSSGPEGMAFGSTAGAVAAVAGRRELDPAALRSFLRYGSVRGPKTVYRGVAEVDPGTVVAWHEGGLTSRVYWSLPTEGDAVGRDELRNVLARSLQAHVRSDVPVGLFLSGGLDSATLAALGTELGLDLTAFTVGFPGMGIDESPDARESARTFGLYHSVLTVQDRDPDLDGYFGAADQPTVDGVNTYLVARSVSEAGLRVALSGLGADELFAGYSLYRRVPALALANRLLPAEVVRALLVRAGGNSAKAPLLAAAGPHLSALHDETRSVFAEAEIDRLLPDVAAPDAVQSSAGGPVSRLRALEVSGYLRNTLLRDADVFGMASSVEIRTPFVDHEVLAAAVGTDDWRLGLLGKQVVARAVGHEHLRRISRRRKRGFSVPHGSWLRRALAQQVEGLVDGPLGTVLEPDEVSRQVANWKAGTTPDVKLWAFVVLDQWLRRRHWSLT